MRSSLLFEKRREGREEVMGILECIYMGCFLMGDIGIWICGVIS
jgi:hypothetical protein